MRLDEAADERETEADAGGPPSQLVAAAMDRLEPTRQVARGDGKITLSQVGVERAREREDAASWARKTPGGSGSGLGTLGDLLDSKSRE